MEAGAALLRGAALCNALYPLAPRKLRAADGPLTTLLYTASAGTLRWAPPCRPAAGASTTA